MFVCEICMSIWLYFCSQQQHLLFLVAFCKFIASLFFFSCACAWFESFHNWLYSISCMYPNEILQRVSLYINICIYFSLYPFILIFCIIVLAHVIFFFQWAPFQGPTTTGTYIDTTKSVWGTLIRNYFLHFFSMHFGNEKIQSSEQNTQYWKLSDIVTLSNTEGST